MCHPTGSDSLRKCNACISKDALWLYLMQRKTCERKWRTCCAVRMTSVWWTRLTFSLEVLADSGTGRECKVERERFIYCFMRFFVNTA